MRRHLPVLLTLLSLTAGAAACGDDSDAVAADQGDAGPDAANGSEPDLVGREFLSVSVTENGQDRPLADGTRISLTFEDDGTIGADAGCNHLLGNLAIDGDRLLVDETGGTEMACEAELMEQDDWLIGFLDADPTYRLEGDTLTLEAEGTVIELQDREVADPDQPLEGTTWLLDSLVEGTGPDGSVSSVPGNAEVTLVFDQGRVNYQGCNQGSSTVEAGDGELTFGGLATTRMACGPGEMEAEAAVVAVLDGTVSYEIDAGTLTLQHPDGQGLMLSAAE